MTPEEAKKQLTAIVKKIDTNKDKFVSKEELTAWILKSFMWVEKSTTRGNLDNLFKQNIPIIH